MLISTDEIKKSLKNAGWKYESKKIIKTFSFKAYMESIDFIMEIAVLAEQKNHHPEIYISWCKVDISIISHDLGGVTTNCVNLALGIDSISKKIK